MGEPVLDLRGVAKSYRRGGPRSLRERFTGSAGRAVRVDVLHGIDLTVHRGEVVGVVGRNGGGKSTLLRVAGGLTAPSAGTVHRRAAVSGLLALGAATAGELSGADNAVTAAVLAGLDPAQARARLPAIGEFAELDAATLAEPVRTYSDGMRLRLAFAAASVTEPDLLLVDEVLAVGDMAFQEKCLAHVEALRRRGCAVLVASHVMPHLRRLATRAVWLRAGTVHAEGPAAIVLDAYERSLDERAGTPQALGDGGFRKGEGSVLLRAIACTGADGSDGTVERGGALAVSLTYERVTAVPRAHFGVSLRRVGEQDALVDLTTEASGAGAVPLADAGRVSLVLDRVDLAPGEYWLDAGIYATDWEVPHDYRWDTVRVVVSGPAGSGPVQPPHRWSTGPLPG
ncbi:ABC transporter ATP-binding protein [Kineococcus rubinsiae]|uniref:ABC transporter ATP-binding protein n=1 Tax=Kineococcus rubinsiae TaxID=2609562 RepID=UPI0014315A11|nr:ATP-binding cassette domain-containing protein [Kineococcus rubinsiae]